MKTYPFNKEKIEEYPCPKDYFGHIIKDYKDCSQGKTTSLIEFDLEILSKIFPDKNTDELKRLCGEIILSIARFKSFVASQETIPTPK